MVPKQAHEVEEDGKSHWTSWKPGRSQSLSEKTAGRWISGVLVVFVTTPCKADVLNRWVWYMTFDPPDNGSWSKHFLSTTVAFERN